MQIALVQAWSLKCEGIRAAIPVNLARRLKACPRPSFGLPSWYL